MSKTEPKTIIIKSCDECILQRMGSKNGEPCTVCIIEKEADVFRCTFGLIPQNCPLRQGEIIIRLSKTAKVMA